MEEVSISELPRRFSSFRKKALFPFDVYFSELGAVIESILLFIMIRGVYNENFLINPEGLLLPLFEASLTHPGEASSFVI